MNVKLSVIGVDVSPHSRSRFIDLLEGAFDRLRSSVRGVEVRMRDVNGARGGLDKLCTLRLVRDNGAVIYAHALARSIEEACRQAAVRAVHQLVKHERRRRYPSSCRRLVRRQAAFA